LSVEEVVERSILRPDGRRVGWTESGTLDGRPVLRMPGTPGSRFSIRADRTIWTDRGIRMITIERPGFGVSTRLPGRAFVEHAHDVVAVLDELGIGSLAVLGGSGGGPHLLAFAATYPERVAAAAIVVGAAPIADEEAEQMIPLNRDGRALARAGNWTGLRQLLAPVREQVLLDPIAGFRATMATAPAADHEIMIDPVWQAGFARGLSEALRLGVDGWTDESFVLSRDWTDFNPGAIRVPVVWWHGDGDRNAPLSAARRLAASVSAIQLRIWEEAGHLAPYRNEAAVLDELLSPSHARHV
jgi:pimeloyl-ACP methyl ester carboxylesterase